MRGIRTIAWRDFKTLVTSPMYMLIAGVCSVVWSYIFIRAAIEFSNMSQMAKSQGQEGMNIFYNLFFPHISVIHLILIFAVPVLTMRLLSEEKKLRTFDLLLTAPITSADIAVGKFLAGFGAAAILAGISFLYPLMISTIAEFNWLPLFAAYIGLLLVLGLYVAVGLFTSALTESAMLAVILAMVFNIAFWFVGQNADAVESTTMFSLLNHMSLSQNFAAFLKGTLKFGSGVFFVSLIAFFVFLAERVIESARWRA
jgi:ABC-2 type transport system permease protein